MRKQLKKASDTVFQQPSEGSGRPLEWRKSLQFVNFEMFSATASKIYDVNDVDGFGQIPFGKEAEAKAEQGRIFPFVSPKPARKLVVTGRAKSRDTVYTTSGGAFSSEPPDGLYSLERPKDGVEIRLQSNGDSPESHKSFPKGVFFGNALRSDADEGRDELCINCQIPESQLAEIVEALAVSPDIALEVGLSIEAFSFEVDDSLREWYQPRELFIHRVAFAIVRSVVVKRAPDNSAAEGNIDTSEVMLAAPAQPVTPPLREINNPKSSNAVLWAIAVILLLHLFK
jgi:hypothetical protein